MSTPTFDYQICNIDDLKVAATPNNSGRLKIDHIEVDGRVVHSTPRFMTSLCSKYGFGPSIFDYFNHDEVFNRIIERKPHDKVRLTIENGASGARLLGVSAPTSVLVEHDDLISLFDRNDVDVSDSDYGSRSLRHNVSPMVIGNVQENDDNSLSVKSGMPTISYADGIVRSVHVPRNHGKFQIGPDTFQNRFVIETPIDGYGKPSIYLMLLRAVCTNGAIAFAPAFRSQISLGKNEDNFEYALTRVLEGFNNEEGFEALRLRFESALKSWASIAEVNSVYKALAKIHNNKQLRGVSDKFQTDAKGTDGASLMENSKIMIDFNKMVGDLTRAYGMANLDQLGTKRQRTLPSGCNMYDLMNFITEVATHHTKPAGSFALQATIGTLVSSEFDLENTIDKFPDWKAFLVEDESARHNLAIAQHGKN